MHVQPDKQPTQDGVVLIASLSAQREENVSLGLQRRTVHTSLVAAKTNLHAQFAHTHVQRHTSRAPPTLPRHSHISKYAFITNKTTHTHTQKHQTSRRRRLAFRLAAASAMRTHTYTYAPRSHADLMQLIITPIINVIEQILHSRARARARSRERDRTRPRICIARARALTPDLCNCRRRCSTPPRPPPPPPVVLDVAVYPMQLTISYRDKN